MSVGLVLAGIALHGRLPLGNHGRRKVLRAAQLRTPRLLGSEGVLRALENGLVLVLGDNGKKSHCKGMSIGHVAADKIHS